MKNIYNILSFKPEKIKSLPETTNSKTIRKIRNKVFFLLLLASLCVLLFGFRDKSKPFFLAGSKTILLPSLPQPDADYLSEFERIQVMQLGLNVTNINNYRVGCSEAKPGPWVPLSEWRQTVKGKLHKYEVSNEHASHEDDYYGTDGTLWNQDEYDWNLIVYPSQVDVLIFGDEVKCEVTPSDNFRDNNWFPLKGSGKPSLLLGYDICVYGPHVRDPGASDEPNEIHPIDAIWWQREGNSDERKIMLIQDAAKGRFRDAGMYTKKPCDDDFTNWRPWVEYPQMEEIKIPFVYDPSTKEYTEMTLQIEVSQKISTRIISDWKETTDGPNHSLLAANTQGQIQMVYKPTMLMVKENPGMDDQNIVVQFTELTRDSEGIIRGYVRLLVGLGTNVNEDEGIMVFTIILNQRLNQNELSKE